MKKILVAVDGSRHSDKALKTVKDLLRLNDSLSITVLYVIDIPNNVLSHQVGDLSPALFEEQARTNAETVLARARDFFRIDGFEIQTLSKYGHPATVICKVAEYEGYDLIVVGSRGLGAVKGLFMGSISSKVAHLAPCPVLIVK